MNFSDLLNRPFDAHTGILSNEAVLNAIPGTSKAVGRQFYADHGRKSEHQGWVGSAV